MKKAFIFLFIVSALGLTVLSLANSRFASLLGLEAGGFGISPPYVKAYNLRPGDAFQQRITIMRGNTDKVREVNISLNAEGFADWLEFNPGKNFIFPQGEGKIVLVVLGRVPDTAANGEYKGYLNINLGTEIKSGQIGIGLGAVVEIDLSVSGGLSSALPEIVPIQGIKVLNQDYWRQLSGNFVIRVEKKGEIYYIDRGQAIIYEIPNNQNAVSVVKEKAIGIEDASLRKIPIGLDVYTGNDQDFDSLPDGLEKAIGTSIGNRDTDGDGFSDYEEVAGGFDPLFAGQAFAFDELLRDHLAGRFLIQTEGEGELWYVNPRDRKRYYLGGQESFFGMIANLSIGIRESDFQRLLLEKQD